MDEWLRMNSVLDLQGRIDTSGTVSLLGLEDWWTGGLPHCLLDAGNDDTCFGNTIKT